MTASERQQKADPPSLLTGDLEFDLMDIHDALGNGKSQTVAALSRGRACPVAAIEALEDLLRLRLGDLAAGIVELNDRMIAGS